MDFQQLLAAANQHLSDARPLMPMYLHLIISSLFPIYTGAHASLSRPSSAAKPYKKDEKDSGIQDDEDEEEDVVQQMEGLTPRDALLFPVTAGIVLAGLYWLIKRYGADIINLTLGWYFAGVGVFSVAKILNDAATLLMSFIFPDWVGMNGSLWIVDGNERRTVAQEDESQSFDSPIPQLGFLPKAVNKKLWQIRGALKQRYITKAYLYDTLDVKAKLTAVNLLSAVCGAAAIAYANLASKPWYMTNLQGFAVCYSALQFMSPTTFATGSLILSGLFFYDIWAVFFTPFMVGVAKNLDVPIKLVFPRPSQPSETPGEPPLQSFSMLGLGDIVLPGIMIGLALRFDLYLFYLNKQRRTQKKSDDNTQGGEVEKAPYIPVTGHWGDRFWTRYLPASVRPSKLSGTFPKPYFTAAMVGYTIGMLTTLGVMSVFHHAQPALLYLVPGVLISLWGTGAVRGELKQMWEFSEAITGEQLEEDEKVGAKKPAESEPDTRDWKKKLWDELLGVSGTQGDTTSNASAEAEKKKSENSESDDGENDMLVSFSIARYTPQAEQAAKKQSSKADAVGNGAREIVGGKTQTSSDTSSDAVLLENDES